MDHIEHDNELKHYGVVGMKWGVRRGNKAKRHQTTALNALNKMIDLQDERVKTYNKNFDKSNPTTSKPSAEEKRLYSEFRKNTGNKANAKKHYSKAFTKATKKANKLNQKAVDKNLKAAKLQKKALEKEVKATNEKQYQKARKIQFKANELNLQAAKLEKKGKKWEKKMESAFSNVSIKDVNPVAIEAGKKYAYMLTK